MSRHTPGPWSADNTGIHGYRVLANDERRTIVCDVTGSVSNTQARADAHLIAAAPELADALSKSVGTAFVLCNLLDTLGHDTSEARERLESCYQVLAKSRGTGS